MTSTARDEWSWRGLARSLRRRALPLVVAAVVGAGIGFVWAGTDAEYKSTTVLGVRSSGDIGLTDALVNSAASTVVSDVVINAAAEKLGVDAGSLSQRVSATVQSGTTLIDLSAVAATPEEARLAATTVSEQALLDYRSRSQAVAEQVRAAGEELLVSGKLSAAVAESARQTSIGSVVGSAQGESIEGTVTISTVSPAVNASRAGISRVVGALLGAAAAVLATLLVVLSRTWRRFRRVRNLADLEDVDARFSIVPGSDVDLLAGEVLEGARASVVLVDTQANRRARAALAAPLADALARAGLTVARLTVIPDAGTAGGTLMAAGEGAWTVGDSDAYTLLRRVARGDLPEKLHGHVVVIDLDADAEAAGLLHGQRDFQPVVAVERGSRVSTIERVLAPYERAEPLVVLVDR